MIVHEITQLKQTQIALEELNVQLDERVRDRTQAYLHSIEQLEQEITRRKETEKMLQEIQDSLVDRVSVQSRRLYSLYDVLINKENVGENGDVLSDTLGRVMQMMNADAACIHQSQEDRFYLFGSVGLSQEISKSVDIPSTSWLQDGKPLVSTNLPEDHRIPEALRLSDYSHYLAAPITLNGQTTGILQVFWREAGEIQIEDISYFSILAEQIGIILENERLRVKLEGRLVQGERRRLARDLHDSVTQSLHSLLLNVGTLRSRLEQGRMDKVGQMLVRLEQSAHQALKEMRLPLFELCIAPLEDVRLVEALQNRLEAVEVRAGIDVSLHVDHDACWPPKWEAEL